MYSCGCFVSATVYRCAKPAFPRADVEAFFCASTALDHVAEICTAEL